MNKTRIKLAITGTAQNVNRCQFRFARNKVLLALVRYFQTLISEMSRIFSLFAEGDPGDEIEGMGLLISRSIGSVGTAAELEDDYLSFEVITPSEVHSIYYEGMASYSITSLALLLVSNAPHPLENNNIISSLMCCVSLLRVVLNLFAQVGARAYEVHVLDTEDVSSISTTTIIDYIIYILLTIVVYILLLIFFEILQRLTAYLHNLNQNQNNVFINYIWDIVGLITHLWNAYYTNDIQIESDIKEEQNFAMKRLKRRVKLKPQLFHNDCDRVFTVEELAGLALPGWLRHLTHAKLKGFITNLEKYARDDCDCGHDEFVHKAELRSLIAQFRTNYHTYSWLSHTINVIRATFTGAYASFTPINQKVFQHHDFIPNPVIYAPELGEFGDVECGTFWYDLIAKNTVRHHQLTPNKIRSIIQSNMQRLTKEDILTLFTKKMTLDMNSAQIAWVFPYIPYDYLFVMNTHDVSHLVLSQIRDRVLIFVQNYLKYSMLPKYEQTRVRKFTSDKFTVILGKPKYQQMFIEGVSRQTIMDTVYFDHYQEIYGASEVDEVYDFYRNKTAKYRTKQRTKERDYKYADDIESESFVGWFIVKWINWFLNKIAWRIFGIHMYRVNTLNAISETRFNTLVIKSFKLIERLEGNRKVEWLPKEIIDYRLWHNEHILEPVHQYTRDINFYHRMKRNYEDRLYMIVDFCKHQYREKAFLLWHHQICQQEYWHKFPIFKKFSRDGVELNSWSELVQGTITNYCNYDIHCLTVPLIRDNRLSDDMFCATHDEIYDFWRREVSYWFELKLVDFIEGCVDRMFLHAYCAYFSTLKASEELKRETIDMIQRKPSADRMRKAFYHIIDIYPIDNRMGLKYRLSSSLINMILHLHGLSYLEQVFVLNFLGLPLLLVPTEVLVPIPMEPIDGSVQYVARYYNHLVKFGMIKTKELQWEYFPHERYRGQFAFTTVPIQEITRFQNICNEGFQPISTNINFCTDPEIEFVGEMPLVNYKDIPSPNYDDIEPELLPIEDLIPQISGVLALLVTTIFLFGYLAGSIVLCVSSVILFWTTGLKDTCVDVWNHYNARYRLVEFFLYVHMHIVKFYYGNDVRPVRAVIDTWSQNFFTPQGDMAPDMKIVLVNIKAVLHAVYYAFQGQYGVAISHATYCILTEPKLIIDAIRSLQWTVETPAGPAVDPWAAYDIVTENDTQTSIFSTIGAILHKFDIVNLSDMEIRRANAQFTYMSNGVKAFNGAMGATNKLIAGICRTVYGFDPYDFGFRTFISEMIDSKKAMDRYLVTKNRDLFTKVVIDAIIDEYAIALKIVRDPRMEREVPSFASRMYMARFLEFEKLYKQATNFLDANIGRFETVGGLFCGPNSVGKSAALKLIKQLIVRAEYLEAKAKDIKGVPDVFDPTQEFIMNEAAEYFEGYHQQKIVICDDFGSSSDVADRRMGALPHIHD